MIELVGGPCDGRRVIMVNPETTLRTAFVDEHRQIWTEVYKIRPVPSFSDPVFYDYVGREGSPEVDAA